MILDLIGKLFFALGGFFRWLAPNKDRPFARAVVDIIVVAALAIWALRRLGVFSLVVLMLVGCGPKPTPKFSPLNITTSEKVRDVLQASTPIMPEIVKIEKAVEALTPANVEAQKPVILEMIGQLKAMVEVAAKAINELPQSAVADAKEKVQLQEKIAKLEAEIKELKADDPTRFWLRLIGIGVLVFGLTVVAFSVLAQAQFPFLIQFKTSGIAISFIGLFLLVIVRFITQIYWIGGLSLLAVFVGAGIWAVLNRKVLADKAKSQALHAEEVAVALNTPPPAMLVYEKNLSSTPVAGVPAPAQDTAATPASTGGGG